MKSNVTIWFSEALVEHCAIFVYFWQHYVMLTSPKGMLYYLPQLLEFCHHLLLMGNYPFCVEDTSDDSWGLEGVVISSPNSYFVMAGRQYRNWQFTVPIAFSSTVAILSRRRGFPTIRSVSSIERKNPLPQIHRHMQWWQEQSVDL